MLIIIRASSLCIYLAPLSIGQVLIDADEQLWMKGVMAHW